MIYVLRLTGTNYKENRIDDIIKIGYTEDSNFDSRMSQYKLHNPLISILFTIKDADEKIEGALHRYFYIHRYDYYGKEWFHYDQEIIDFFNKYNTKELLEKELVDIKSFIPKKDSVELYRNIKLLVNRWLCLVSNDNSSLIDNSNKVGNYILDCKNKIGKDIFTDNDIISYLKIKYNISEQIEKDLLDYLSGNIKNSEIVNKFLKSFNNLKGSYAKLKYLCNSSLNNTEIGIVLDQIPLIYKQYYEILGKDRCKSLSYDPFRLNKELSLLQFNKEDLKYDIYLNYKEGDKYSKSSIKENLQRIYNNLNYNKTAKANDIEEYFEVKDRQMLNPETGKKDHYFELIKKKD